MHRPTVFLVEGVRRSDGKYFECGASTADVRSAIDLARSKDIVPTRVHVRASNGAIMQSYEVLEDNRIVPVERAIPAWFFQLTIALTIGVAGGILLANLVMFLIARSMI